MTAILKSDQGDEFKLRSGRNIIGRDAYCDIMIIDPYVSRMHAEIFLGNGEATLIDTNSTNGVWVNGRKIHPSTAESLGNGDSIQLGQVRLQVILEMQRVQSTIPPTAVEPSNVVIRQPYAIEEPQQSIQDEVDAILNQRSAQSQSMESGRTNAIVRCPACGGSGRVQEIPYSIHNRSNPCGRCIGRGKPHSMNLYSHEREDLGMID